MGFNSGFKGLKPKCPTPIIHKVEETNKMRLETIKIRDVCGAVHRNIFL